MSLHGEPMAAAAAAAAHVSSKHEFAVVTYGVPEHRPQALWQEGPSS